MPRKSQSKASKQAAKDKQAAQPSAATEAKAAEGNTKTDQDELRDTAQAQSEVRRASVDEDAAVQPSATYAENEPENPIDREDVEADVPRPKVYSSADMMGAGGPDKSKTDPARTATERKILDSSRQAGREPTATEKKLAEQGIIPPYR
jgi:hypothetical protein